MHLLTSLFDDNRRVRAHHLLQFLKLWTNNNNR